jgi:hypothetical protein
MRYNMYRAGTRNEQPLLELAIRQAAVVLGETRYIEAQQRYRQLTNSPLLSSLEAQSNWTWQQYKTYLCAIWVHCAHSDQIAPTLCPKCDETCTISYSRAACSCFLSYSELLNRVTYKLYCEVEANWIGPSLSCCMCQDLPFSVIFSRKNISPQDDVVDSSTCVTSDLPLEKIN